jgi:hypothetical protein
MRLPPFASSGVGPPLMKRNRVEALKKVKPTVRIINATHYFEHKPNY